MSHPLLALYDAQILKYRTAMDASEAGLKRLRLKAGDHASAIETTTRSHAVAAEKLSCLLRQRESLVRDLVSLGRLKEITGFLMSWRDQLSSDAKNPKLPEAQRHFSMSAARRLTALLSAAVEDQP